ncbi:hypothetical protein [Mesorhizobium sp.]|uniref:hypothetical protein n=1 Tax=Mesorhizobium sp. TaxID=1871066 RepID=UPI000FE69B41|nr:hypothetical protein [Mesorhizobium sp.]RWP24495.1 MAG: hypothetical protein EOR02_30880 [Mesorhizobium sp.]
MSQQPPKMMLFHSRVRVSQLVVAADKSAFSAHHIASGSFFWSNRERQHPSPSSRLRFSFFTH